ncbi:hypothetical protein ACFCV3_08495 [Kribbella sp. NPDC056345]|uniref:hypothetical protein n=1 Tax=Kribbella sp. NPDC056345 TaxID=3345789 RepID=UPI0035E25A6B
MRILIGALALALASGCSSAELNSARPEPTPTTAPASTPATASNSKATPDACDLLTASELAQLMEGAGDAKPGLTGAVPNCQWSRPDGRYVQVIGIDASVWARSLPEILRALQSSGMLSDTENARKLRAAVKLLEAGQNLDPDEACSLFSQMLELQGRPPKSSVIVTVIPTRANPKGVTGQMCSLGTFTSVMVANEKGLTDPLPIDKVSTAIKQAHRRAIT